jgi:hypothetical protein
MNQSTKLTHSRVTWDSPRWGLSSGQVLGSSTDGWLIVQVGPDRMLWIHDTLLRGAPVRY